MRAAEGVEIDGGGLDTVQAGERVHKVRGDARRLCRLACEDRGKLGPDGNPGTVLHEEERRAQDRGVLAQMECAWRQRKLAPQPREHPMLAGHVVRPGRQGPRRRPAENARLPVHLHEVVVVGESGGELPRRWVQGEPMTVRFEIANETRPVLGDGVGAEGHVGGVSVRSTGASIVSVRAARSKDRAPRVGNSANASDPSSVGPWSSRNQPFRLRDLGNVRSCAIDAAPARAGIRP